MKFREQESRDAERRTTVAISELVGAMIDADKQELHDVGAAGCTRYRATMEAIAKARWALDTYQASLRKEWKAHWNRLDDEAVERAVGEKTSS